MYVIERPTLDALLAVLQQRAFTLVGPTVRDGAIVYDEIAAATDLPIGWTDEQEGGTYHLERRDDAAVFGYVVGPQSWKRFLFPPTVRLWHARRETGGFQVQADNEVPPRFAFIGVRACELHAIGIQDKVLLAGAHVDSVYEARRQHVFIVAVNCGQAGGTCFCVSMQTGPQVSSGFDLALTEIIENDRHAFVVEVGTDRGAEVLHELPHRAASEEEQQAARLVVERAAGQMGRRMDTTDIKELLYRHAEHPRWDDVANRCLACGNCTMVCPTCFCTTVEDTTDLTGEHAERWRTWDSCFTLDFSYIHGGSVRASAKSRYRQWLTHKLASWIDQFGTSGCVGCGRCITWCPVAIDITEEVSALRASENATLASAQEKHDGNP
ncbi:MAG: 4Fe-4S dicluster domain-containing protein [Deltaproteobacteria bacterium]|nr:4Fe-4S dicluster domain-containing protein [Deltaproteobacteria bacterium]